MSLSQTVAERELLLAREPFFSHDQVAGRYGSMAALEEARKSTRVIVGTYKGSWVYPAFQFLDAGPAPDAVARLVPYLPSEPRDGGWSASSGASSRMQTWMNSVPRRCLGRIRTR